MINANALPDCSLAVCTNFNHPIHPSNDPAEMAAAQAAAKVLIDADFACLTEAYIGDNANATPPNLDRMGKSLGWKSTQPVFGVYNAPLSAYDPWKQGGWSVYLAEYLL